MVSRKTNEDSPFNLSITMDSPGPVETSSSGRFTRVFSKETDKELGHGAFKRVYLGYDNYTGSQVAWNSIKTSTMTPDERRRVMEEINLLKRLEDPHILKLIKVWRNKAKDEVVMITELMSSSLKEYLILHPEDIRFVVVQKWARDILEGLVYLHEESPPVIHRDLKCDNIFISAAEGTLKIGDMGFSTELVNSFKESQVGTTYFMAPEIFESEYETKVDIYAFGMCLIEIATFTTPYSECRNFGEFMKKINSRELPEGFYRIADPDLRSLICECLKPYEQRPSAESLLKHPFFIIKDERIYKQVSLFEENKTSQFETDAIQTIRSVIGVETEINKNNSEVLDILLKVSNADRTTSVVEFQFNKQDDVPEQVVEELVNEMELTQESIPPVLEAIENHLIVALNNIAIQEPRTPDLISDPEEKTPFFSQRNYQEISINLGIETVDGFENKRIVIDMDMENEKSEEIAVELVKELDLAAEEIPRIAEAIQRKIEESESNRL